MLSRQPGRGHPNLTLDHAATGYRSLAIARLCSVLRSAEDSAQHVSVEWEEVSFSCHSYYLPAQPYLGHGSDTPFRAHMSSQRVECDAQSGGWRSGLCGLVVGAALHPCPTQHQRSAPDRYCERLKRSIGVICSG